VYRKPSRRKKRNTFKKLDLIPILDAVFIFICFLLMSASFIKIFEIGSDVPIVSSIPPKEKEVPLALTLKIYTDHIALYTGIPSVLRTKIDKKDDKYNLEELHNYLINIKQGRINEKTIILEPLTDLSYEELVSIMDSIRLLTKTDVALYRKDKNNIDVRVEELFDNIIFGNIQS